MTDNREIRAPMQTSQRDQAWLESQLEHIWQNHFHDVARLNTVTIQWGRANRNRLGSITGKGGSYNTPEHSQILINSLLRNPEIPESVILQTIAHELSHYAHGFCSPHPQKYNHPHRGRVIENELFKRNLSDVYLESQKWLKQNWYTHVSSTIGVKRRKVKRSTNGPKRMSLLSHLGKIITG